MFLGELDELADFGGGAGAADDNGQDAAGPGSFGDPDPACEVFGLALDAERGRGHQVTDQAAGRGAAGDLLGGDLLGRPRAR